MMRWSVQGEIASSTLSPVSGAEGAAVGCFPISALCLSALRLISAHMKMIGGTLPRFVANPVGC